MENLTPPPAHQYSPKAEEQRQQFLQLIAAAKPLQKLLQNYDVSHTVIVTADGMELLQRELYINEKTPAG